MKTKICTKCNEEKELKLFVRDAKRLSGYRSYCKSCHCNREKIKLEEYRKENLTQFEIHKREACKRTEKVCTRCKETKRINQFYKSEASLDGHGTKCIECCKIERKLNYLKTRTDELKIKKNKYNIVLQQIFKEHKIYYINLLGGKCNDCGTILGDKQGTESFDFHHKDKDEKYYQICRMLKHKKISANVHDEIVNKCIVLCSNCHRKFHHG